MSDPASDEKPRLVIDMVADPVCPWCYVGKRALDRAVMALSFSHDLVVRYRPYQLAPDLPQKAGNRRDYMEKKFPDKAQREQMAAALVEAAREAGLALDPSLPELQPNTLNALRLIRWSHFEGRQAEIVEGIFSAYWHKNRDISDPAVLAGIARSCGMDGDETLARLETDEDRDDIAGEIASFRQGGVSAVPTFIVNEAAGFPGAYPPDKLLKGLRQLAGETEGAAA